MTLTYSLSMINTAIPHSNYASIQLTGRLLPRPAPRLLLPACIAPAGVPPDPQGPGDGVPARVQGQRPKPQAPPGRQRRRGGRGRGQEGQERGERRGRLSPPRWPRAGTVGRGPSPNDNNNNNKRNPPSCLVEVTDLTWVGMGLSRAGGGGGNDNARLHPVQSG